MLSVLVGVGRDTKNGLLYHLLVQDLGPVYPWPHIRDVQLFVEGPVLCTQLRHTVMELLDAAEEKRDMSLRPFGSGGTKELLEEPRFHS